MALDVVVDVIAATGRFVGRLLTEVVLELLCKGTGYLICKRVKPSIDPNGWQVGLVGLVLWVAVIGTGFYLYQSG